VLLRAIVGESGAGAGVQAGAGSVAGVKTGAKVSENVHLVFLKMLAHNAIPVPGPLAPDSHTRPELGADTPVPAAKRRRVDRAAADGEDEEDDDDDDEEKEVEIEDVEEEEGSEVEGGEERDVEEAKAAAIKHMEKDLQVHI
jgi:hypothetical protein